MFLFWCLGLFVKDGVGYFECEACPNGRCHFFEFAAKIVLDQGAHKGQSHAGLSLDGESTGQPATVIADGYAQPFFGLLETDVHVPLRFFGESMLEGIARDFSYDKRQAYGNGSGNKARGSGKTDLSHRTYWF